MNQFMNINVSKRVSKILFPKSSVKPNRLHTPPPRRLAVHHYSFLLHTVRFDDERSVKAHVAKEFRLVNGGESTEGGIVIVTIALEVVNREICHTKTRQVLEEVRALARVHTIVRQTCLHNHLRIGDVRPFDGNALPWVTAAPTSAADEDIVTPLLHEAAIERVNLVGDGRVVGSGEVFGLDIDHILHIVNHAVSDGVVGA